MMRRTLENVPGSGAQPPVSETDRPGSGASAASPTGQITAGASGAAPAPMQLQQRQAHLPVTREAEDATKRLADALRGRRGLVSEILDATGRLDSVTPFINLFNEGAAIMAGIPAEIRRSEAELEDARRNLEPGNYYQHSHLADNYIKSMQTLIKTIVSQRTAVDEHLKEIGKLVAELGPTDPGRFFATLQKALEKWSEALAAARSMVRCRFYGELDHDKAYFPLLRKEYEVEREIWGPALAAPQSDEKRRTAIDDYLELKKAKVENSRPVKSGALASYLQAIEPNPGEYWVRVQKMWLEKGTIGALQEIRSMLEPAPEDAPGQTIGEANRVAGLLLLFDKLAASYGDSSGLSRPLIGDSLALLVASPDNGRATIVNRLRDSAAELDQWASSERIQARAHSEPELFALHAGVRAAAKELRARAELLQTGDAATDRELPLRALKQITAAMEAAARNPGPH